MLEVRARFELGGYLASLARPFGWKACGEKRARNCTLTTTLLEAGPHLPTKTAPHPTCKLYSTKSWDLFFVCFCIKKILTDTISKTQMSLVEGTAENTWVPPERQHQGLHGPPTSPTLEQLGVWTTGSCLGLRPSPSHLGRRQERGLPPSINKCRPNPWGPGLGLSWDFQRPLQQLVSNSVQGRKDSSPAVGDKASLESSTLCSLRGQRQRLDPGLVMGVQPPQQENLGQFAIGWSSHI